MKTLIKNISLSIGLATLVTGLSSCKSDEEKRREANQKVQEIINESIAPIIREREQREAQIRQNEAEFLDAAGRVIGSAIEQSGHEQNTRRGSSTQQQADEYYRRQNQNARDKLIQDIIR